MNSTVEELRGAQAELREQNERLLRTNAALELERQRYAELFQLAPVGYLVSDPSGVVCDVNDAAAKLFGAAPSAVVGQPLALLVDAADRDRWRGLLARVIDGSARHNEEVLRVRLGDHSVRVRIEGSLRVAADGAPRSCLWILEDVTVSEQAAETERLTADARRKDEFLAMLGHELRNPLAPIRAAVELWRHHAGVLTEEQRQWTVDVVSRQADHLAHLVDDLLDVSRLTHNKIRLRRAVIDLREIIEQSRDVLRAQAQLHQLELVLPSTPLRVDGDTVRLRQVLVNLLDNALKFTPRGGRIMVRAGIESGSAVVRIEDDGIGIAPELLDRVFGSFTQGDHPLAREAGGLGLGLTLVRRLVELHGGTVTVHSKGIGRGSEFTISLPLALGATTSTGPSPAALGGLAGLRLLVVDDNVDGAQMLGHLLDAHGHHSSLAFDGAGAIEMFDQLRPDAALLDLGLPDIDGLEVARHIRARFPAAHLIAITGYGDDRIRAKARESGFTDHLLKPVDLEALRRALDKVPRRGE
jgi:two-component system, chemotaxis family, CheB/CheR fusion protein